MLAGHRFLVCVCLTSLFNDSVGGAKSVEFAGICEDLVKLVCRFVTKASSASYFYSILWRRGVEAAAPTTAKTTIGPSLAVTTVAAAFHALTHEDLNLRMNFGRTALRDDWSCGM